MPSYSYDVHYAYAQLGIEVGATFDKIHDVWTNTTAYRFATSTRKQHVQRFVDFFVARSQLGIVEDSFEDIRKSYHRQAKILHPDKNKNHKAAEDQLKIINAAYEIVDKINREAKTWFQKSETSRREIENELRETAQREAGVLASSASKPKTKEPGETQEQARQPYPDQGSSIKFMAASVPRYIRNSRLYYLGSNIVIGSRRVQTGKGQGLIYDVIMLPEREFMRARLHLGLEGSGSPELSMSRLTPAYVLMDTKQVFVPRAEGNPYTFARDHFVKEFRLDDVET